MVLRYAFVDSNVRKEDWKEKGISVISDMGSIRKYEIVVLEVQKIEGIIVKRANLLMKLAVLFISIVNLMQSTEVTVSFA